MAVAAPIRRTGTGRGGVAHGVPVAGAALVRVGIYARISEADRSNSTFDSVDHQIAACRSFVESRASLGWHALPEPYLDNGFTGANTNRPGLARLLTDVRAGRLDLVLVHRIDRLSRSLRDLLGLLEVLEEHGVSFASVNESFDSSTPIGKATLQLVGVFAELERSTIAARTAAKMKSARRLGLYCGGIPAYGFRAEGGRLVVDEVAAERVREAYRLYLQHGSLIAVAEEMNARGWRTQTTQTRFGRTRGNRPWNKGTVHALLTHPAMIARNIVDGEAFPAQHEAIVPVEQWERVQAMLQERAVVGSRGERQRSNALLAGIVRCHCGAAMTPTFCRKGPRKYSFYACSRRVKGGKGACSAPYVSAPAIETAVVARIAEVCRATPGLVALVAEAARSQLAETRRSLSAERRALQTAVRAAERDRTTVPPDRLPALDARVAGHTARLAAIRAEGEALAGVTVEEGDVARAVATWDEVWQALLPRERRRAVELLVARAVVPPDGGPATVTLHATIG